MAFQANGGNNSEQKVALNLHSGGSVDFSNQVGNQSVNAVVVPAGGSNTIYVPSNLNAMQSSQNAGASFVINPSQITIPASMVGSGDFTVIAPNAMFQQLPIYYSDLNISPEKKEIITLSLDGTQTVPQQQIVNFGGGQAFVISDPSQFCNASGSKMSSMPLQQQQVLTTQNQQGTQLVLAPQTGSQQCHQCAQYFPNREALFSHMMNYHASMAGTVVTQVVTNSQQSMLNSTSQISQIKTGTKSLSKRRRSAKNTMLTTTQDIKMNTPMTASQGVFKIGPLPAVGQSLQLQQVSRPQAQQPELQSEFVTPVSLAPAPPGGCVVFPTEEASDPQNRNSVGQAVFPCSKCKKAFTKTSLLDDHMQQQHASDKLFSCDICGKGFSRKTLLQAHRKTHSTERPYKCKQCDKGFPVMSYLSAHEKTHTQERPYQCSTCGKSFRGKNFLNKHQQTHAKWKPYVCLQCHKSFRVKSYLSSHLKTHTTDKPFQCDQCNRRFSRRAFLNTHLKTHSSEKPFVCDTCDKRFTLKSYLDAHVKTHCEEKPFLCVYCSRTFREMRHLNQHLRNHHGDKSADEAFNSRDYPCLICNEVFPFWSQLVEHSSTVHGNGEGNVSFSKQSQPQSSMVAGTNVEIKDEEKSYNSAGTNLFTTYQPVSSSQQQFLSNAQIVYTIQNPSGMLMTTQQGPQTINLDSLGLNSTNLNFSLPSDLPSLSVGNPSATINQSLQPINKTLDTIGHLSSQHKSGSNRNIKGDMSQGDCSSYASPDKDSQNMCNYICEVCSKTFTRKDFLHRHRKIHSGDRPYKCDTCGKGFLENAKLSCHLRTHTGEKPYQCCGCHLRFASKFSHDRHRSKHCRGSPMVGPSLSTIVTSASSGALSSTIVSSTPVATVATSNSDVSGLVSKSGRSRRTGYRSSDSNSRGNATGVNQSHMHPSQQQGHQQQTQQIVPMHQSQHLQSQQVVHGQHLNIPNQSHSQIQHIQMQQPQHLTVQQLSTLPQQAFTYQLNTVQANQTQQAQQSQQLLQQQILDGSLHQQNQQMIVPSSGVVFSTR